MGSVSSAKTQELASLVRRAYSLYQEVELLIRLNEYQPGTDPLVDEVVNIKASLDEWCKQSRSEPESPTVALSRLGTLIVGFERLVQEAKA